jgi:hypothetical protein
MVRVSLRACAATALVFICLGCGQSNGLYPVHGKVLFKGEPATGAIVRFVRHGSVNQSSEQSAEAIVQDDGTFKLTSGQMGSGAAPGTYDVLIEWRSGPATITKLAGRKPDNRPLDRLHGSYADPRRPRFQAEILAETNRLPPFDLTDGSPN